MTDPIRAALERLIARLDETTDPNGPVPAWSDSYLAARAALAQPEPPAEGEVEWTDEQLIEAYQKAYQPAWERGEHYGCHVDGLRAVLALSRCAEPAPVPVSERLPEPEDCDAEGRCWLLTVEDDYPQWRLHSILGAQPGGAMIWVPVDSSPGVMVDCFYTSHWLPFHALPLPAGEVAA